MLYAAFVNRGNANDLENGKIKSRSKRQRQRIPASDKTMMFPRSTKQWWHRRAVKRSIPVVQAELERLSRKSSSNLNEHAPAKKAAVFHRSEIITGELLGTGGFAFVYEIKAFLLREDISSQLTMEERDARQKMADSTIINGKPQFAIKFLQSNLAAKTKSFHRAARDLAIEAKFLSSLCHPGINSLKGVSIDGIKAFADGSHDSFFLITERLTETLEDRLERWASQPHTDFSLQTKIKVAEQLAEVLRYLHENRIIFRDLKPSNMGFAADDSLKLFDFGFSRKLPEGGSSKQVYVMTGVGTRRYMAPEVIRQVPYNQSADVYGWSMIFWQILHLQKPFADLSQESHEVGVCRSGHRPPISSHYPESIRRVLEKSWVGCPRMRLTAADVCSELVIIRDELHKISGGNQLIFNFKSFPSCLPSKFSENSVSTQPVSENSSSLSMQSAELLPSSCFSVDSVDD